MADLSKCNPLHCPQYAQGYCEYCFELDLLMPCEEGGAEDELTDRETCNV